MQKNNRPLVSIVTPTYNSEDFIAHTVASVQAQTVSDWEMIIVDDASKDGTKAVVGKISKADPRVKLFANATNSGAAVTRNVGLENATGRYLAFLDSDDLWKPEKLAKQIAFMTDHGAPIACTSYDLVNEQGEALNKIIHSVPQLDYTAHLKNTAIGMSTSMIDTNLVKNDFRFINIRTRQDCYLWITLLKRGHIAFGMPEVLASYRVRKGSISSNKFKGMKKVWYLYYDLEKLGLFRSAYYFFFYAFNALKKRL
ncbi:glycosyltransferase family 2 protein [Flagellimonas sp. DF-77]|uniref:glycosyltransferase family 2 protein n=1 Tax=Flagellimonas algarum TaxID=3230298 RepID=UPI0033931507